MLRNHRYNRRILVFDWLHRKFNQWAATSANRFCLPLRRPDGLGSDVRSTIARGIVTHETIAEAIMMNFHHDGQILYGILTNVRW